MSLLLHHVWRYRVDWHVGQGIYTGGCKQLRDGVQERSFPVTPGIDPRVAATVARSFSFNVAAAVM